MGWIKIVEVEASHKCPLPEIISDLATGIEGVKTSLLSPQAGAHTVMLGAGSEWACTCRKEYVLHTITETDLTMIQPRSREVLVWSERAEPGSACPDHKPVQHRDRKRPWCNNCGRAEDGKMIGAGWVEEIQMDKNRSGK